MYKEKKPLYVDPFDFQAHMFSIRWVIRLDHLLIFDRLMLSISLCRQAGKYSLESITNSE